MRVRIEEVFSLELPAFSWVPQGSVIDPLLFLIDINVLPASIRSRFYLFADNVELTYPSKDLNQTLVWTDGWCMQLNVAKCSHLHLGSGVRPVIYMCSLLLLVWIRF